MQQGLYHSKGTDPVLISLIALVHHRPDPTTQKYLRGWLTRSGSDHPLHNIPPEPLGGRSIESESQSDDHLHIVTLRQNGLADLNQRPRKTRIDRAGLDDCLDVGGNRPVINPEQVGQLATQKPLETKLKAEQEYEIW